MADFYDTLGVARDATPADIKAAHKRRRRETHPDAGGSTEAFQEVEEAARVLLDPRLRLTYDRTGTVDDGPEKAATMMARQALLEAISRCQDVEHVDLVANAKNSIGNRMAQQREIRRGGVDAMKTLDKVRKRISAKGGPDILGDMIEAEKDGIQSQISAIDETLKIMERAVEIIDQHAYRVDPAERSYYTGGMVESWAEMSTARRTMRWPHV